MVCAKLPAAPSRLRRPADALPPPRHPREAAGTLPSTPGASLSQQPFLWPPPPLCPRPQLFLLQTPPLGQLAVPPPPTPRLSPNPTLKFWRARSTNGAVSPLGHRSALIRFGPAEFSRLPLPDPSRGQSPWSRSESADPISTFSSFTLSWGRGGVGEGERRGKAGAPRLFRASHPLAQQFPNRPSSRSRKGR